MRRSLRAATSEVAATAGALMHVGNKPQRWHTALFPRREAQSMPRESWHMPRQRPCPSMPPQITGATEEQAGAGATTNARTQGLQHASHRRQRSTARRRATADDCRRCWRLHELAPQQDGTAAGCGRLVRRVRKSFRHCSPNFVARAHADPLRDWSVLLQLLGERLLCLEGLVGRLCASNATGDARVGGG